MARPVAADAEATRRRILAAAVELVSAHGIDGTTVRDVAAAAKVSLATVLHYYGSKDGLYAACVEAMDQQLAQLRDRLAAEVVPGRSGEAILEAMVQAAWLFAREHKVAHRLVLRAVLDKGSLPPARIEQLVLPSLQDAEELLSPLLGISPLRARMALQTFVHLLARYAIYSNHELKVITKTSSEAEALATIGGHLVDVARGLLLPTAPPTHPEPPLPATPKKTPGRSALSQGAP
jgi:AcrR family transcriptional regulator